ncbi:unnamed protein product [Linum trigynum]|uniref:Uncharacterized protein n=1 Tax=Linum trigynum TaxID=586398 RepID=A0AAV2FCQ6_9ROSI
MAQFRHRNLRRHHRRTLREKNKQKETAKSTLLRTFSQIYQLPSVSPFTKSVVAGSSSDACSYPSGY